MSNLSGLKRQNDHPMTKLKFKSITDPETMNGEIEIRVRLDRSVEMTVQWYNPQEHPETSGIIAKTSGDVLAYSETRQEHTIAWFDFKEGKWMFLCREPFGKFKWRYLLNVIDKP